MFVSRMTAFVQVMRTPGASMHMGANATAPSAGTRDGSPARAGFGGLPAWKDEGPGGV